MVFGNDLLLHLYKVDWPRQMIEYYFEIFIITTHYIQYTFQQFIITQIAPIYIYVYVYYGTMQYLQFHLRLKIHYYLNHWLNIHR